jgi:hypothetical protein
MTFWYKICHHGWMDGCTVSTIHYHEAFEVYVWFLDAFVVPVHQLGQLGNVMPCRFYMLYIAMKSNRDPAN